MTTLSISNFLSIKKAHIDIRRINVFIGPQAQGKSVISKLIYYFKEIPSLIIEEAAEGKDKRQFDASCKLKFEKIFPSYAWENTGFLIVYDSGNYKISVENEKAGSRLKFHIKYTSSINAALSVARRIFKSRGSEFEAEINHKKRPEVGRQAREAVAEIMSKTAMPARLEQLIYIPAGRSFFAYLQKSIFSFISTNIPIDHFLKEFGAIYEITRDNNLLRRPSTTKPKIVQKLVESLICGTYEYEKGQDWIVGDRGRVSLSHSSSGQQEALPMAMILSTWPYLVAPTIIRSFVIEEPEAHLFPVAQGQVMSLIAVAYNSDKGAGDFVITTHSPYILTALNNLIQADNTAKVLGESRSEEVYEIISKEQHVKFEDVSAYTVSDGYVNSILDPEYRLLKAEAIDGVSEFYSSRFERLIELEVDEANGVDDLI